MDAKQRELEDIMRVAGMVLVRERKHRVYRHPSGRIFVTAKTASDRRAIANNIAELRRFLARRS